MTATIVRGHGTLAAYIAGCDLDHGRACDDCRSAHAKWHALRKVRIIEGSWEPFTDPAPARAALARLSDQMTLAAIRRATGISITTLTDIRDRVTTRVRHEIADALIDLTPTQAHDALLDATGTRRRLQALAAMGWSFEVIGAELGISLQGVSSLARRERVTAVNAARVREVYRRLAMLSGPSEITRRRARERGWVTAAAWDDIDDPGETPAGTLPDCAASDDVESDLDPAVFLRMLDGDTIQLDPATRAIAVRRLSARGLSAQQIAQRCGVAARTIVRDRAEHGISTPVSSRYDVRRTA